MNFKIPLFLFAGLLLFSSCEKALLTEEEDTTNTGKTTKDDADSKLTIVTRAPSGEQISYPVTVYIMDGEGSCVKKETLAGEDDELSVKLPAATYQVYAIAGASGTTYTLPAAADASANYEIALKDGAAHTDLMTAQNTVTLGSKETNVLTLGFARKVMNVKSITINDVPDGVTAVSVKLTPLYKSIRLNGEYVASTGEPQSATISLTCQNDGTTWKNTSERYLLPAVSAATVTVSMTLNGNITSSSYSTAMTLQANSELNITGTYTGNAGEFTMSGVFTGAVWGEPTNINFTFNDSGAEDAGSSQGGGGSNTGDGAVPAKYTWYKNCFVFLSTEEGNNVVVTLLHPSEVEVTDASNRTLAEINTLIQAFDNKGISGWRLPVENEAKAIHANIVNADIDANGGTAMSNGERYFYEKDDHSLGAFFGSGDIAFSLVPTMYLRPVTTLTFPKQ